MKHYDGPAFYRRFLHESTQLKKEKEMQAKTYSKNVIYNHNEHHSVNWTKKIEQNKINNPIAERTQAFKPRHNYNNSITNVISIDNQSDIQDSKYVNIINELLSKNINEYLLIDGNINEYLFNQHKFIKNNESQSNKDKLNKKDYNNVSKNSSTSKYEHKEINNAINNQENASTKDIYKNNSQNKQKKSNPSNNQRLGHSLSSILNSENNVQKRLSLFNDESKNIKDSKRKIDSSDLKDKKKNKQLMKHNKLHKKHKIKHVNPRDINSNSVSNINSNKNNDNQQKNSQIEQHDSTNDDNNKVISHSDSLNNNEEYRITSENYKFPKFNLLSAPQQDQDKGLDDWILKQAEILDKTLNAFKVKAKVVDWTNGPTVTQFQIKLQLGVKVNKITNLTDDLKLALAAKDIRIEAPIPGKTTVGIEIPNPKPRPVMLSEVLESDKFKDKNSALTVALGVDLSGKPQVTDLRKMPHGLIAGATGSGKSVFINSLLVSLLYKATPDQLKLILIDPKAVEMEPYNNIPHLLSPVISEPKEAAAALKWTVKEMNERYERLSAAEARNIEQYNQKAEENNQSQMKMPYILIVIDELADLMMTASDEVENYIVRITQKARAAGIHLIVATQRPSVDVVTGTIKNNIPTRVAFMVSSQIDSRTIIDTSGAERLLGKGDMLYLGNGSSQSIRLQGTFVTSDEIDRITNFVRTQGTPYYAFQPRSLLQKVNQVEKQDKLMPRVLQYISKEKNVSTSKLQRVFSIGYNRAANLIDDLERNNYVSGQHGSKPRDVYLNEKEYQKLNL